MSPDDSSKSPRRSSKRPAPPLVERRPRRAGLGSYFRAQAREARRLATLAEDASLKQGLHRVAAIYDGLADQALGRKSRRPVRRRKKPD